MTIEWAPEADRMVQVLHAKGRSHREIATELRAKGYKVSDASVRRRIGVVVAPRAPLTPLPSPERPSVTPPLPDSPEAIPEDAPTALLDEWIGMARKAITAAEAEGDFRTLGGLLRVASALAETRRKATPPTAPDPNDDPDMLALAEETSAKLHRMVDEVTS